MTPAAGVFLHPREDSEEQALPDGDRSSKSASESAPRAGDIPRSDTHELFLSLAEMELQSPMDDRLDGPLLRPGMNESHDGEEDEVLDESRCGEDETLGSGSESNFSDLDPNR